MENGTVTFMRDCLHLDVCKGGAISGYRGVAVALPCSRCRGWWFEETSLSQMFRMTTTPSKNTWAERRS